MESGMSVYKGQGVGAGVVLGNKSRHLIMSYKIALAIILC